MTKHDESNDSDLPRDLSQPALRALHGAGYHQLEQFTSVTEAEIKRLHGVGPKAITSLRRDLSLKGLSFAGETSKNG